MYWRSAPAVALREAGVPVYATVEAAVRSLERLAGRAEERVRLSDLPEPRDPPDAFVPDYWGARDLLAAAGIPFADARRVRSLAEARAAARELGYPVVLKAASLLHKSDAGGVALGLRDEKELGEAFSKMTTLGGDYSVER